MFVVLGVVRVVCRSVGVAFGVLGMVCRCVSLVGVCLCL